MNPAYSSRVCSPLPTKNALRHDRKLGTLVLEAVQTLVDASQAGGNLAATAGNATESSGDGAGTLDLSGSRDFLTREAAEEALAAMLVENAALRKVGCQCIGRTHVANLSHSNHTR